MSKVDRITLSGREIAAGDSIVVKPSLPGRRDGFTGKFLYAETDETGAPRSATVFGSTGRKAPSMRTFTVERLAPVPLPKARRVRSA